MDHDLPKYVNTKGDIELCVFHGACLSCTVQRDKGISVCNGCLFHSMNTSLPILLSEDSGNIFSISSLIERKINLSLGSGKALTIVSKMKNLGFTFSNICHEHRNYVHFINNEWDVTGMCGDDDFDLAVFSASKMALRILFFRKLEHCRAKKEAARIFSTLGMEPKKHR